jgi:biofilm PGA synthesis N-glycosyltransferase PgaC
MKWLFWVSVGVVAYAYAGYPLLLYLRSRWLVRPVHAAPGEPSVSIVVAVRNEAATIAAKLQNLSQLRYPENRVEMIVVSDGSTDATPSILNSLERNRLQVIVCRENIGKSEALNRAVAEAKGEIVMFTDARQTLEPEALVHLVENFADPTVGCVSGELLLEDAKDPKALRGAGLYWKLEKQIRKWEGDSGSVVGATGAIYAVRRELIRPLPPGTILDDVYIPLVVVRQGFRVVFEPRARAWDRPPANARLEFRRKVRTLTGNYQLLQLAPWLLTRENPLRFQFLSHKIVRLVVPFALASAFVSSLILAGPVYRLAAGLQVLLYASAVLALIPARLGSVSRVANVALTFVVLNAAAVVALVNFLTGKKEVWVR